MIGPWCFVDYFGPTLQTDGMVVAAHPHIGLQTVTWLLEGEIEHRDSLGSIQLIRPGQLNLMTAGSGIAHSEISNPTSDRLHAVQLWLALDEQHRNMAPAFEHHAELPMASIAGGVAKVMIGEFGGTMSPATHFHPMVAAELRLTAGSHEIALNPEFESGLLVVAGDVAIQGEAVAAADLKYVEAGAASIRVECASDAVLLLLGGAPFGEKILMWWNFIARNQDEITQARAQWNARDVRFGAEFEDRVGGWIPAPDLPNVTLQPR
jgi:redox-sensitive bicupin YhaK (pirin superfamily)